jgi:uncharacterized membrane protein HdeD (DUF308 family)
MAWLLCITGIIFCIGGIYLFYKNVYEKHDRIWPALVILLMGVMLIAAGTAKYLELFR